MRPKPFLIGTLAYLLLAAACMQPASLLAQAPLVTRAAPLNDPAWTNSTPRSLPSGASLPPLPGSSSSNNPTSQPLATPGVQASAQFAPMPGATQAQVAPAQVVPAQFTSSDAMPPASLRSSGGKPIAIAGAQASLSDSTTETNTTSRPLKPRSQTSDSASSSGRSTSTVQMIVSVISSLLIVVALLLGAAWCYRKAAPSINGTLPKDAVHLLGRTAIAPRQQLMIIRFGSKLLLVSNLQGEVRTLSEIDDPLEVDRIAGLCESAQAGSISHSFRTVLHNLGGASE